MIARLILPNLGSSYYVLAIIFVYYLFWHDCVVSSQSGPISRSVQCDINITVVSWRHEYLKIVYIWSPILHEHHNKRCTFTRCAHYKMSLSWLAIIRVAAWLPLSIIIIEIILWIWVVISMIMIFSDHHGFGWVKMAYSSPRFWVHNITTNRAYRIHVWRVNMGSEI